MPRTGEPVCASASRHGAIVPRVHVPTQRLGVVHSCAVPKDAAEPTVWQRGGMRPRSWTDEELRAAVASSERLIDVLAALGLTRGGGTLRAVRNRILVL
jgi:hypothetical protein